jgi:hypothetical protein
MTPTRHLFGDGSEWCKSSDVAALEAVHAALRDKLHVLVAKWRQHINSGVAEMHITDLEELLK